MRTLRAVLVTGGAGFAGSALVRHLLAHRPHVRVVTLDALTYAGSLDNLADLPDPSRHAFVHGDVLDTALVAATLRAHDVDTVLHLAAETHVDRSIAAPGVFLRTNVEGTASVLDAARAAWGDRDDVRFHHVSTDEVYGDLPPDAPPCREDDPFAPSSPYAASKAAAEHVVRAWRRTYGLPVSITRASNLYGPRQVPEKLVPRAVAAAVRGESIPLYGDGRQVRAWLHVDDHADALLRAVEWGTEGGCWNVGAPHGLENRELLARLCAALDRLRPEGAPHARRITPVADRPGHDRRYAIDSARAAADLGWRPTIGLDDGLVGVVGEFLTRR